MKIYKNDMEHIMIVVNEKKKIISVDSDRSSHNKISILFMSQETLTEKAIKNWGGYSFSTNTNYQRIEVSF